MVGFQLMIMGKSKSMSWSGAGNTLTWGQNQGQVVKN